MASFNPEIMPFILCQYPTATPPSFILDYNLIFIKKVGLAINAPTPPAVKLAKKFAKLALFYPSFSTSKSFNGLYDPNLIPFIHT